MASDPIKVSEGMDERGARAEKIIAGWSATGLSDFFLQTLADITIYRQILTQLAVAWHEQERTIHESCQWQERWEHVMMDETNIPENDRLFAARDEAVDRLRMLLDALKTGSIAELIQGMEVLGGR